MADRQSSGDAQNAATAYDLIAYPATLFPEFMPDNLAMIATLHGLAAPEPATARVLEIAGGDGVNMVAGAARDPGAFFHSFDLSEAATRRGQALARASGLDNVRIERGDVIEAAQTLTGPYDYVIAHGLYAWVPEPVRAATLRLIGRVLSPTGVAFVSYNALPGGYLRMAIRDMLLHHVADITDPQARVRAAFGLLAGFSRVDDDDRSVLRGLRDVARPMLDKGAASLFHDELGEVFEPQSLTQVVQAARENGLAFLNDASPLMVRDGLPDEDLDEVAVVREAQSSDYSSVTFFHQTLLVRPGRAPSRLLLPSAFERLYGASRAVRKSATEFLLGEEPFKVDDRQLGDALEQMASCWPERMPLAPFAGSRDHCDALLRLYRSGVIGLYVRPLPGVRQAGARPLASPVARAQIAAGATNLFALDHKIVAFDAPGPRAFIALLDGSRDREQLARDWAASPYGGEVSVEMALAQLAQVPMLLA